MNAKRRIRWRRVICVLLLLCLVVPNVPCQIHEAKAAGNMISPTEPNGRIQNGIYRLSYYEYGGDGSLTLRNSYHYEPGPITTYYTVDTVWSKIFRNV